MGFYLNKKISIMAESMKFLNGNFGCNFSFLFASAASVGINIWVTFVAGPVMIRTIDRHTFLIIQSKMFPVYFVANSIISTIQLALLYQQPRLGSIEYSCAVSSGITLLASLLNWKFVGKNATKVFMEKMKIEKDNDCIYPKIPENLKSDQKYQGLLSTGKKYHIVSALLGLTGTLASFYTVYKIAQAYTTAVTTSFFSN